MRLPLLIFAISGIATMQLEPIATGGAEALLRYAHAKTQPPNHQATDQIRRLQSALADVEMDLMKVLATDPAVTSGLERREEDLKYALRAAEIRSDESAQCLRKRLAFLVLSQPRPTRCAAAPEKHRS